MDDDADAVPLDQIGEVAAPQRDAPATAGHARRRIHETPDVHTNSVYEPQVNRPWDDVPPAYEPSLSVWESYKYSVTVALIVFGVLAIVLRWPVMILGRDKMLAIAALAFCAGWAFHTVAPLL